MDTSSIVTHRLSQEQKNANDFEYYKSVSQLIDSRASSDTALIGWGGISDFRRKKVNYDLFNNTIDLDDFTYVCQPYGTSEDLKLPARLTNRDIVSGKMKALLGMEMRRPFGYKVMATNKDATTRKETVETDKMKDYVISSIMGPIHQQIELKYQEQSKGRQLTEQEQQQIQSQIEQEVQAQTPDEVRRYMLRKHQDPVEVLTSQILEYLRRKEDLKTKFNLGFKHGLLSGEECYWSGIVRGDPKFKTVNSQYLTYDRAPGKMFIEEGDWVRNEMHMTRSEILIEFGDKLKDSELDDVYNDTFASALDQTITPNDFSNRNEGNYDTKIVYHYEFKGMRKIGFLKYRSFETGGIEEEMVNDTYQLNAQAGDISIRWKYIPERHEMYRIGKELFVQCRPVQGQHKDLTNLFDCRLSYTGVIYDNLNSEVTAVMDRIKGYQYFYNIIWYRLEIAVGKDKGKKVAVNINAIPKSMKIDLKKFAYYMDALDVIWLNPSEEGKKGTASQTGNIGELVKEVDMSMMGDITKYINILEYIEKRCGESIGIPKPVEGQIDNSQAVTNTKQTIVQTGYVLEPYFDMHNLAKRNALQSLLEVAKVAYCTGPTRTLAYILDDMSSVLINLNEDNIALLDGSTVGIFVDDTTKSAEIKDLIEQLAHAGIQNQMIDLSDVVKVVRADGVQEAEEMLETSEARKRESVSAQQTQAQQLQNQNSEAERQHEKETWKHEADMIILKESERRKTVIKESELKALSFSEDKDLNDNGMADILEVADHALDVHTKTRKLDLEEKTLEQRKKEHEDNVKLKEKALAKKPASK